MKKYIYLSALTLLFAACQKPLYKFRNYDEAAYKYATSFDEKDIRKAEKSYKSILGEEAKNKSKKKKKKVSVPPGIYADYAVIQLKKQDTVKAREYFDREIRLYPESQTYVNHLKKRYGL